MLHIFHLWKFRADDHFTLNSLQALKIHGEIFIAFNFDLFPGHFAPKWDTILPLKSTVHSIHGGIGFGRCYTFKIMIIF